MNASRYTLATILMLALNFMLALNTLSAQAPLLPDADTGTLLFEDFFERNESQETKDELGSGWGTNSANRAGGNKQVDLGDGTLHVYRHDTADHSVSVVHPAEYRDCRVELKFRLGDKRDDLGIDFADLRCKEVHAGHICKIFFRSSGIEMQDLKSGRMNKTFHAASKAGTATDEQKAAVKKFQKKFSQPVPLNQWHSAIVTIAGDTMSVELNGKSAGRFSSPGIGHSRKDMVRFSVKREAWLDDVRMLSLKVPPATMQIRETPVKHLFVATLLLRRMKPVGMTAQQSAAFNKLSSDLRSRIDRLRSEAGIGKDTIAHRDEIYKVLKTKSLTESELYLQLQKRGGFTDAQRDAFRETQKQYKTFKSAALNLLTKEQRAKLTKPGKRK